MKTCAVTAPYAFLVFSTGPLDRHLQQCLCYYSATSQHASTCPEGWLRAEFRRGAGGGLQHAWSEGRPCAPSQRMRADSLDAQRGTGQIAGRDSGRWFPGGPASGMAFFVHKLRSAIYVRFHTTQPDTEEFKDALLVNRFNSFHGDDTSIQPGRSGGLWLRETGRGQLGAWWRSFSSTHDALTSPCSLITVNQHG